MKHIVRPIDGKPGRIAVCRPLGGNFFAVVEPEYPAIAWHIAEAHADRLTRETSQDSAPGAESSTIRNLHVVR